MNESSDLDAFDSRGLRNFTLMAQKKKKEKEEYVTVLQREYVILKKQNNDIIVPLIAGRLP